MAQEKMEAIQLTFINLLGRIQNAQMGHIILAPDLKENLAKGDKAEVKLVNQIDAYIEKNKLEIPIETLPQLRDGYDQDLILDLDLKSTGITNVIWATGYKFDFEDGYPVQKRGVTEYPGLYFIGLPFLHNSYSGTLSGVGDDAAHVVSVIALRSS